MCSFKLTADTGAHIVARPYNGQNALYAGVGTGITGIVFTSNKIGGYGTTEPLRIELTVPDGHIALLGTALAVDPAATGEGRKFEVVWLDCNQIALKASNGLDVSRETDGSKQLQASRKQIGTWETFTVAVVA